MIRALALILFATAFTGCSSTPKAVERTVRVQVTAPTAGYTMKVTEVHAKGMNLLVLAETEPPAGMAAQVLTTIGDAIRVTTNAQTVICYVLGPDTLKAPNGGTQRYVIITDRSVYERAIENARKVPFTRM